MDLAGQDPVKLKILLSPVIVGEHELHDMGGEVESNATTELKTYFRFLIP